MAKTLYQLAKAGDFDAINARLERAPGADDFEDSIVALYQWYTIAAEWHDKADEIADALEDAQIRRYGDETLALAHLEIGQWWLLGEHGLPADVKRGLAELAYAKKVGLDPRANEIETLRAELDDAPRASFDALFPPVGKKKAPATAKRPPGKKAAPAKKKAAPATAKRPSGKTAKRPAGKKARA